MKTRFDSSSVGNTPKDASSYTGFWGRIRRAWNESAEYVSDAPEQTETEPEHLYYSRRGDQPYIGEIQIFAGNFAPLGWAFCNGQLLSIAEYSTLFTLIGTTYGGDGQTTFALPDLRGRIPIHMGQGPGLSNRTIGEMSGMESVTLNINQMPAHSHLMATGTVRGTGTQGAGLTSGTQLSTLTSPTTTSVGGSQPHENMPPYLCISYIIALEGIYPAQ